MEQDPTVTSSTEPLSTKWRHLTKTEEHELFQWLQSILFTYCNDIAQEVNKTKKEKVVVKTPLKTIYTKLIDKVIQSFMFLGGGRGKVEGGAGECWGNETVDMGFTLLWMNPGEVEAWMDYEEDKAGSIHVQIKYRVGGSPWIYTDDIKVYALKSIDEEESLSPSKKLSGMLETTKREISCYSKIFPAIQRKDWELQLGVPSCYYGNYERQLIVDTESPSAHSHWLTYAVLVLQDLPNSGYVKKKEPVGQLEAKAVIRAIAQIHATTWILQKESGKDLLQYFPFLINARAMGPFYTTLARPGLRILERLLRNQLGKAKDGNFILEKLASWERNLNGVLNGLLSTTDGPVTLLHMDLRIGNIHFLESEEPNGMEVKFSGWKLAGFGPCMNDVAFFLLSSLRSEDRVRNDMELVMIYYQTFLDLVRKSDLIFPFSLADLYREYQRSLFLSLLIVAGNVNSEEEVDEGSLNVFLQGLRQVIGCGLF